MSLSLKTPSPIYKGVEALTRVHVPEHVPNHLQSASLPNVSVKYGPMRIDEVMMVLQSENRQYLYSMKSNCFCLISAQDCIF